MIELDFRDAGPVPDPLPRPGPGAGRPGPWPLAVRRDAARAPGRRASSRSASTPARSTIPPPCPLICAPASPLCAAPSRASPIRASPACCRATPRRSCRWSDLGEDSSAATLDGSAGGRCRRARSTVRKANGTADDKPAGRWRRSRRARRRSRSSKAVGAGAGRDRGADHHHRHREADQREIAQDRPLLVPGQAPGVADRGEQVEGSRGRPSPRSRS